jgi:hypothetical protein
MGARPWYDATVSEGDERLTEREVGMTGQADKDKARGLMFGIAVGALCDLAELAGATPADVNEALRRILVIRERETEGRNAR